MKIIILTFIAITVFCRGSQAAEEAVPRNPPTNDTKEATGPEKPSSSNHTMTITEALPEAANNSTAAPMAETTSGSQGRFPVGETGSLIIAILSLLPSLMFANLA